MIRFRDWSLSELASLLLATVASGWLGAAAVDAALLEPPPAPARMNWTPPAYPHSSRHVSSQDPLVLATIQRHPMRADRSRPHSRFGAVPLAEHTEAVSPAEPVPEFRIAGVVRREDGHDFAAIAADRSPPQLLRTGESLMGFRLIRVRSDSVLLSRADTAVSLAVPGFRASGSDR